MSRQAITVKLPEEIIERIKRAARATKRPVNQILADIVRTALPSLEKIPPEYRQELEAMESMSDEQLWKTTEELLSSQSQRQIARLLRKNGRESLTKTEEQTLTRLRKEADRLMMRRSYAYLLLKSRGYSIPAMHNPAQ